MPMPRSLPRFFDSRLRAAKPFQSATSIMRVMLPAKSPLS